MDSKEEAKLHDLYHRECWVDERETYTRRPQLQGSNTDNRDSKYFVYGQGGHLKRQCPQLRQGKPVEVAGAIRRNTSNRTTTNHLTGQD